MLVEDDEDVPNLDEEEDEVFTRAKEVIPEEELDGYGQAFESRKAKERELIDALLADYAGTDLFPFLENPPPGLDLHLVLAGRSSRWQGETGRRVAGLERVTVHRLPDAGHWVHIDDPDGLRRLLGVSLG